MNILINPGSVGGLGPEEQRMLQKLLDVYQNASVKNAQKEKY